MSDRALWLIASREGALALPDDTFAAIVPEVLGLRWRDFLASMPRGFPRVPPRGKEPDDLVLPEIPGWPLPVWREPTRVPDAIVESARAWIAEAGEPVKGEAQPWPGIREAARSEVRLFRARRFEGGRPDPKAPAAFAASSARRAAMAARGEKGDEPSVLARALLFHELDWDLPHVPGGAFTKALRRAAIEARKRLPKKEREALGKAERPGLGNPTDRVAELAHALRLECLDRERGREPEFSRFLRRLLLRAVTPNPGERLLERFTRFIDREDWESIARLVVAAERQPDLYGNEKAAAEAAKSLRSGLDARTRKAAAR